MYKVVIGKKLEELRNNANYSLRKAAPYIYKTHATLHNYEKGKEEPSLYTIKQLCRLYGYDLRDFICDIYDRI